MAKVKWKTPDPGQVEIEPEGGHPFYGPPPTIVTPWAANLQVGDLLVTLGLLKAVEFGSGKKAPLPFLMDASRGGAGEYVEQGEIGMYLGTQRTNEYPRNRTVSNTSLRMERGVVLFRGRKFLIENFNLFKPINE
jgi:hypothetical protein